MRSVSHNPLVLRWYFGLTEGMLTWSVIVPYFSVKGVDLSGFLLTRAILNIALIVLEIPTGYIADRYPRKLVLWAGALCWLVSNIWLLLAHGLWQVVGSQLVAAMAVSLISGTVSATLYDGLLSEGRIDDYAQEEGKLKSFGAYMVGIMGVFGALLFSVDADLPQLLSCITVSFALVLAWLLVEPPMHKVIARQSPMQEIKHFVHYALRGHAELPWIILYSGVTCSGTFLGFLLMQAYWEMAGLPYWTFGLLLLSYSITRGWAFAAAPRLIRDHSYKRLFITMLIMLVAGFLLQSLWVSPFALWLTFIPGLVYGITHIAVMQLINTRVESHMRATVLSIESLSWRTIYVVISPLAILITSHYGLQTTYTAAAIVWFALGILAIAMLFRKQRDGAVL